MCVILPCMRDKKICPKCKLEKTFDKYTKKRGTFGWLCKGCMSLYQMERRKVNPKTHDGWLKGIKAWKKKNPHKLRAYEREKRKRQILSRPPKLCPECSNIIEHHICHKCRLEKQRLFRLEKIEAKIRRAEERKAEGLKRTEEKKRLVTERKMVRLKMRITDSGIIRQCSTCQQWKPIEEFKSRTCKCWPCFREIRNAESRRYFKNNPHKRRARDRKRENRKRNVVGSYTDDDWLAILETNGHKCVFCGSSEDLTKDHIFPTSLGGTDYPGNLQPLCRKCNSKKGNHVLSSTV